MKKPHNVMYLRRAVRHLFDTDEKAYKMRVMMANVVIGQILPDGVVRGGTSMKLRYGHHATRFTMDFDAAQRLDVEEFERRLAERLKTGWDDFSGRIVPAPSADGCLPTENNRHGRAMWHMVRAGSRFMRKRQRGLMCFRHWMKPSRGGMTSSQRLYAIPSRREARGENRGMKESGNEQENDRRRIGRAIRAEA